MTKRAFLLLTLFSVGLSSCEMPDIGVAYNPALGNKPVVDLNQIDGSWNFNRIEVLTNNNDLYSIEGQELANKFADLGFKSTANVQRFLRNKMEFDAENVKAYVINQATPFQGSWKYAPESEKLVLFANAEDAESYTIKALSGNAFAISTAQVKLADIPLAVEQQTFEQVMAQQIGQKIIELNRKDNTSASNITTIQLVIRYQR